MGHVASGVTVLCVDDEPSYADLIATHLERKDTAIDATGVTSATDGLSYLDEHDVDCIVSDYDMPGIDGLEFLETVRARDPDMPFLLFTSQGSESLASEAVTAGVTDYIQKTHGSQQYAVLAHRIRNAVERVRAKATADAAQERTKRILDATSDSVLISVADTVVYANPAAVDLFGAANSDDLCGRPLTGLVEPTTDGGTDTVEHVVKDDQTAGYVEQTIRTLAGNTIRASVTACDVTWDSEDGTVSVISDRSDIDEREHRLEALHEATRQLMAAEVRNEVAGIGVNAAADIIGLDANAVHLINDDGELEPVAATAAARELVGDIPTLRPSDSIAWRVYESGEATAVPDVRLDSDVQNPETPIRSELYLPLGKHGILIAASATVDAFNEADIVAGRILAANMEVALAAVERDRQLRDREQELSTQNDRLEQFATVVSHDLRNPLNVAIGRLEAVKEEHDDENIAAIEQALDRMQTLIDDLLLLARTGDSVAEMETVALATAVTDCWEVVDTGDAALVVDTDRKIQADMTRLKQLLENLIRNAVEHSATDSQLQSEGADRHGSPAVTITVTEIPDGFAVSDDGPGVPESDRETVFESGYSTTTDGTGFGLSIVSQIAAAHDWTVTLTESDTGGARFEFTGVDVIAGE
ncbi:two-component system sensor histidine kinase [Haloarcula taiwanensis]|uniref:histidine kinase n=1 Tax=Haloarcula taiwanensis TaxID=1932004 RepID=A0A2H5A1G1_9EURY|nr:MULTISPECIES: response regulator [Haloarcula]AUG48520.1 two-component system sensor histidine kinase [Haloarcula taiwanensis]RLM39872.1 response regulator [Haloarcula sp. Atlit-120R]